MEVDVGYPDDDLGEAYTYQDRDREKAGLDENTSIRYHKYEPSNVPSSPRRMAGAQLETGNPPVSLGSWIHTA